MDTECAIMLQVMCAGITRHTGGEAMWGGLKGMVEDGGWTDNDGKHVAGQISGWIERKLDE